MKKIFIVANWKSHKTIKETEKWIHEFYEGLVGNSKEILLKNKEIIVAPSFIALEHANYCSINLKLPIKFGAQNISPFDEGAYTGEVSAKQIKELSDYVVVGHSERRRYFGEDEDVVNRKIEQALQNDLTPVLCVSDIKQIQSARWRTKLKIIDKMFIAYEPVFAIGSGNPDTPNNADKMGKQIKEILGKVPVLYGGSVTSDNVNTFTQMPNVNGVLVGGASLDPLEFLEIVKNA